MIKSCYIHIPFCKNICSYCDFCKNYYNDEMVSKYIDALEKEIKDNYKKEVLDTLYIGGGTPSSLSYDNLNKLFNVLKTFKLSNNYEFTFECNFEDITDELLKLLKENKVNRISIGIQTFNNKFEDILSRTIDKDKMFENISKVKKYFDNINVDLMYAVPTESINDLKKDLINIIKLDVTHVSTYALIIEDHTKLSIKNIKEISDDLQSNMYYMIVNELTKFGYNHYELSNFAKKGYESRHNLTYWKNERYYGFGAGTSGFINNTRYDNTKSIINYIKGKTKVYEEKLNKLMLMKDEVMLNLRMIKGINKNDFYNKYKIKLEDAFNYSSLVKNSLLKVDNNNLFIPKDKLFISNEIIIRMLDSFNLE